MGNKSIIKESSSKRVLTLFNEHKAKNYHELFSELKLLTEKDFQKYDCKNKIIEWIKNNYNDPELLDKLNLSETKNQMQIFLEGRIQRMDKQETIQKLAVLKSQISTSSNQSKSMNIFLAISIILIVVLVFQFLYFSSYKEYPEDINSLKNMIFEANKENTVLNDKLLDLQRENSELKSEIIELQNTNIIVNPKSNNTFGPSNKILIDDLYLEDTFVRLNVNNISLSRFFDSGSMQPTLNSYSTGLKMPIYSIEQVKVGDIISYKTQESKLIVHRVIRVSKDQKGWFAITKGDNNDVEDEQKVRFEQINGIIIGILY